MSMGMAMATGVADLDLDCILVRKSDATVICLAQPELQPESEMQPAPEVV